MLSRMFKNSFCRGISSFALCAFSFFYSQGSFAFNGSGFSFVTVNDPIVNVPLLRVFLPEGWRVDVKSDWNRCSSASIAMGIVNLVSPDGKTEIVFTTPESYAWSTTIIKPVGEMAMRKSGCDIAKRTFNLPYHQPLEYLKFILGQWGMSLSQMNKVDLRAKYSDFENRIKGKLFKDANAAVKMILASSRGTYADGKVTATAASFAGAQALVTLKNGQQRYSEHIVATIGYTTQLITPQITRQVGQSKLNTTIWEGQLASYYATDVNSFNNNYQLYKTVVENSIYYPQWTYLRDYFGERMALAVMKGITIAINQISQQEAIESIKKAEREEKTADSTQITEAFTDAIYDRNDYTDHEGKHFKVDTGYSVYKDDDNKYYIAKEGVSVPDRFEKMEPNKARDY